MVPLDAVSWACAVNGASISSAMNKDLIERSVMWNLLGGMVRVLRARIVRRNFATRHLGRARNVRLFRPAPENQRGIDAAEGEIVGHDNVRADFATLALDVVEL